MEIKIHRIADIEIAEVFSDEIVIRNVQDALDLMADCSVQGSQTIIIDKKNMVENFFDLRSGLAGEILQKFSTYQIRLAIVGDFSAYTSKSLRDFIFESNKHGRILFVHTVDEAKERLMK
jgi:hypothetical protein